MNVHPATLRKRMQRQRDAQEGIREVAVRVPENRVPDIRRMATRFMREAGKT